MITNIYLLYGLPCLIMAVGVADVVTTDHAIANGGVELNPLIRLAMRHGVWHEAKLIAHFLIAGTVGWLLSGEWFAFGIVVGCVFSAIIGAAVVSNIRLRVRG